MKNKVGRPTKYREEYCKDVDEYLKTTGHGSMHMPKIESFAIRLRVNKTTLYEWAKKHKKFSNALGRILLFQAERLIDDGIYGGKEVNSTIVKLLLQNNHGMKERQDLTTDNKEIKGVVILPNLDDKE